MSELTLYLRDDSGGYAEHVVDLARIEGADNDDNDERCGRVLYDRRGRSHLCIEPAGHTEDESIELHYAWTADRYWTADGRPLSRWATRGHVCWTSFVFGAVAAVLCALMTLGMLRSYGLLKF